MAVVRMSASGRLGDVAKDRFGAFHCEVIGVRRTAAIRKADRPQRVELGHWDVEHRGVTSSRLPRVCWSTGHSWSVLAQTKFLNVTLTLRYALKDNTPQREMLRFVKSVAVRVCSLYATQV